MWEAITVFLALPLLYTVGQFYYRLSAWAFVEAASAWKAYYDRAGEINNAG
jgi:hypothetical protein